MSTDTVPQETTPAPATTDAQTMDQTLELASLFYGPPVETALPKSDPVSPPTTEPGPTATPEASAVSTEAAKPESPTGTEAKTTEIEKPAEKKVDDPDVGHKAAARRLGQEVADFKRQVAELAASNKVLQAKVDGTYEEPAAPSSEEITARAEFKGRETASRALAEGTFGAETVKTQVYDDDSPYKTLVQAKPWLHARVSRHPQPVVEAMRVLKEQEFLTTYGDDVTQWVAKIEAAVTPRLLKDFQTKAAVPVTGTPAPTVTGARGSGGKTDKQRSAEELFYGKPTA